MHPDWVRSVRDQCVAAGVAFFFKQWGEWAPYNALGADGWRRTGLNPLRGVVTTADGPLFDGRAFETRYPWRDDGQNPCMIRVGKKHAGRLLDGREWNEMAEDLRVREFPR